MLVLTRKSGQSIKVGDAMIRVEVVSRTTVRIIIDAPKEVRVVREELLEKKESRV